MGVFTALGVILATHLTASEREPAWVRVAAAVALPVVAVTLYFSFSRGGIAVAIAGVALYLILAHPRGLVGALVAVSVPLAVALHGAYDADLLAQFNYTGADARAQGRSLVVVVIACAAVAGVLRWLTLRIDRRLAARGDRRPHAGGSRSARRASRRCSRSSSRRSASTCRTASPTSTARSSRATRRPAAPTCATRLTKVGNNGRLAIWRVALEEAKADPWKGGGAGTFQLAWERGRPAPPERVVDGHSLYYEVRAELGWIGIALLLVVFAVPLGVAIRRLWGPGRHLHAAFLAAAVALLAHAMVDWDWEMPAVFIWFFGAAGAVLAAPAARRPRASRGG